MRRQEGSLEYTVTISVFVCVYVCVERIMERWRRICEEDTKALVTRIKCALPQMQTKYAKIKYCYINSLSLEQTR